MQLRELSDKIGAKLVHPGRFAMADIQRFYAGDKMSEVLNEASETTLIVTNLVTPQLIRIAELMDVPGVCLLNNVTPDAELMAAAAHQGTTLIVSPDNMAETCERLRQYLP